MELLGDDLGRHYTATHLSMYDGSKWAKSQAIPIHHENLPTPSSDVLSRHAAARIGGADHRGFHIRLEYHFNGASCVGPSSALAWLLALCYLYL